MKRAGEIAEEGLASMAAAGDLHAFNQLAEKWNRRIYNFALRYLGDHDEAAEAAQQTFIKAYRHIHNLREGTQFQAWLYIIAGNTCKDALRKVSRTQTEPLDEMHIHHIRENSLYAEPGQRMIQHDRIKLLKQALAQLPEEQRIVLILKEYEGLKFTEIAHILNEHESTVKSRLYYALKTMRRILTPFQQETL